MFLEVTRCFTCCADVMVPKVESSAYMYELRNITENIVRERWTHSEVQPRARSRHECQADQPVGPAFDIPMTQDRSLEELPSQLDFDWQESVSPKAAPARSEATDVQPTCQADSAGVEVSETAHHAVVHSPQQTTEREPDGATTSMNVPN